ncbi:MAG: MATE family efflux transporter [Bacteroidales bacterium]|nr:MATE family efflux transporter [Bacteroidales bacterium]
MKDLTSGKEGKLILLFALPMLLGNVFQQLYIFVDSIVVGNFLGKGALTAVGASFPVFFALISLGIGLATGAGVVISQFFGAKQYNNVQKAIDTMYIILFLSSVIIGVFGIIFIEDILSLVKLPDGTSASAKIYLTILLSGLVLDFGYNGTAAIFRSLGDSKTPLYFLIIATITNIILDIVFIKYLNMGIEGIAYATLISKGGAFLSAVIYIRKKYDLINLRILGLKFDKVIFLKGLKIGLPSGIQQMVVAIGMMAIYRIVGKFGTTVTDAYSVAMRIDFFGMIPAMSFSMALTAFTGQNIGAGRIDRVKQGLKATILMSGTVAVLISLIIMSTAQFIMRAFTPDEEIIRIGTEYLLIVSSFYFIFSIMFSLMGTFRGAGDTLFPMFITILTLWGIRVPLSDYLSGIYNELGIWYALPVTWAFGMTASAIYYFTGKWKRKVVLKVETVIE